MKQDLIGKWYNPDLTDEQNVSLLKEHGISISVITLKRWRKKQGISKERGGDRKSQYYKDSITETKVSLQNQSIISDQSIKIKVSNPNNNQSIKDNKEEKSKYQNQSIISDQSEKNKVQKSLNQSATFEEAEPLDWDMEDGKFMEIMPKGKITSEMYDKMFGDDSVPHYTGKTPPKQITLETFPIERYKKLD